ncbi:BAI1-associated protein 3-like [Oopsacas minuta]|uniref:BAI1-associated protein 3-like n=1 Tax=Oopsacas minuta TaxID=111878 RepID=A0AAV7KJC7_9METZ|nr:BAI1-associated protein 3-like [Oopsacas minuta]
MPSEVQGSSSHESYPNHKLGEPRLYVYLLSVLTMRMTKIQTDTDTDVNICVPIVSIELRDRYLIDPRDFQTPSLNSVSVGSRNTTDLITKNSLPSLTHSSIIEDSPSNIQHIPNIVVASKLPEPHVDTGVNHSVSSYPSVWFPRQSSVLEAGSNSDEIDWTEGISIGQRHIYKGENAMLVSDCIPSPTHTVKTEYQTANSSPLSFSDSQIFLWDPKNSANYFEWALEAIEWDQQQQQLLCSPIIPESLLISSIGNISPPQQPPGRPLQLTTTVDESTHTIRITTLTNLCAEVAQDLITIHLLYPQILDGIVSQEVSGLLSSSTFKGYFEQISKEDKKMTEENTRKQFTLAILILKLHEHVKDICQFKEHIINEVMKAKKYIFEDYQVWFKPYVLSWMDAARNISIGTVKRAREIDTREFNRQLSWNHEEEGSRIIAKVMKMICDIGKFYSSQMIKIMIGDLDKKDKKSQAIFELNENSCVSINNTQVILEYMREIPQSLNWEELIQESEDNKVLAEEWRKYSRNPLQH